MADGIEEFVFNKNPRVVPQVVVREGDEEFSSVTHLVNRRRTSVCWGLSLRCRAMMQSGSFHLIIIHLNTQSRCVYSAEHNPLYYLSHLIQEFIQFPINFKEFHFNILSIFLLWPKRSLQKQNLRKFIARIIQFIRSDMSENALRVAVMAGMAERAQRSVPVLFNEWIIGIYYALLIWLSFAHILSAIS